MGHLGTWRGLAGGPRSADEYARVYQTAHAARSAGVPDQPPDHAGRVDRGRSGGVHSRRNLAAAVGWTAVERLLLRLAVTALAVGLPTDLAPNHIQFRAAPAALLFAVVLGVLNALVRPLPSLLPLPFTPLTLGLLILALNALPGLVLSA